MFYIQSSPRFTSITQRLHICSVILVEAHCSCDDSMAQPVYPVLNLQSMLVIQADCVLCAACKQLTKHTVPEQEIAAKMDA